MCFSSAVMASLASFVLGLVIVAVMTNIKILEGGHFVPATGEDKKVFVNFLMKTQSELDQYNRREASVYFKIKNTGFLAIIN